MRCPFLRETRVRYCEVAPFRKLLTSPSSTEIDEMCSTPGHARCELVNQRLAGASGAGQCPYLRQSLVQFCDAAAVRTLVPYNDSLLSRCQSDAYRYCATYLQREHPPGDPAPRDGRQDDVALDAIPMPAHLLFADNHMWMDEGELGLCHIGVDAFVTGVIGPLEDVRLVSPRGPGHPTVALRAGGMDLTFVLPERVEVTASNVHLRSQPRELTEDPYGAGWLYEARRLNARTEDPAWGPFRRGEAAGRWMQRELARLEEFVHETGPKAGGRVLASDGGRTVRGVLQELDRGGALALQRCFFTVGTEEER